jgi:hypothetical protein
MNLIAATDVARNETMALYFQVMYHDVLKRFFHQFFALFFSCVTHTFLPHGFTTEQMNTSEDGWNKKVKK